MPTCRICLRSYKKLKFETKDVAICTRCANTLNTPPEPAKFTHSRWAEKLANGMRRNAERDISSAEPWKQHKAQRILAAPRRLCRLSKPLAGDRPLHSQARRLQMHSLRCDRHYPRCTSHRLPWASWHQQAEQFGDAM